MYVIELIPVRRKKGEEGEKKADKTGRKRMEEFVFFLVLLMMVVALGSYRTPAVHY